MRNLGIDPLTLAPSDPAWAACWRLPRGALVRDAVATLRATGIDTRTPAGILAVVDAVAARVADDAAGRRRMAPDAPDDAADVPAVPDDGADVPDDD